MKKVGKVLGYIVISVLVLLVILIGIVFVQKKTNPDEIPTILGYKPFIVLSGSMETELYKGDLAIVKNVDVNDLKVNDIIAFKDTDNYIVTHRIVEIIKDNGVTKFVTKGDNNNIKDSGYVEEDNIEGIYINKISGFGNVVLFMQKPSTLIVTLIIIAVGETIFILIDNSKLSLSDRKELEEYRRANKKEDK